MQSFVLPKRFILLTTYLLYVQDTNTIILLLQQTCHNALQLMPVLTLANLFIKQRSIHRKQHATRKT